ncbi:MAG TPA: hypothetical protein VI932_11455 [Bacteroidota bacterium]|nr:hypothetical protein [Bacteroidota bacterium]
MSVRILSYSLYCLFLFSAATGVLAGTSREGDPFLAFINETVEAIPPAAEHVYLVPDDENLDDWTLALNFFRAGRLDSCRDVLARYNYTLTSLKDAVSGNTFDIFWEKKPVTLGWGTLVYNRGNLKRLNVHVNHPVEDGNVAMIGAELFRRIGAKWMLIGGSSRLAVPGRKTADLAQEGRSVFQRWHELLTDLTQVSVSLHAYNPVYYQFPISVSDVILSNGRTNDVQWGISQLSLTFNDSLRAGGFHAALAMLDSGFARLAGGSNPQAIYSNDSSGFGHWINVELASRVRYTPREYLRFIGIADRALEITQKPISQEINHAFGLVSPRVVKIDRANKLLFPPAQPEKYRIVSFTPGQTRNDTLDLLFGNWLDTRGNDDGMTRVVEYDTAGSIGGYMRDGMSAGRLRGGTVTKLVTTSPGKFASGIRPAEHQAADSLLAGEEVEDTYEPIQVHRIPLQPVFAATVSPEYSPVSTPFHWGGILPEGYTPQVFTYGSGQPGVSEIEIPGLSRFLIPLLKNSYHTGGLRFVGVDMTDLLVNEIARLVSEYRVEGQEIGLMAEQGEDGDYYLRLFPELVAENLTSNIP